GTNSNQDPARWPTNNHNAPDAPTSDTSALGGYSPNSSLLHTPTPEVDFSLEPLSESEEEEITEEDIELEDASFTNSFLMSLSAVILPIAILLAVIIFAYATLTR